MEKKNLVMVVLCVAIGIMAVAYAAFQTAITVSGTVQTTANFKVEFQDVANPCQGAAVGLDAPTAKATITASKVTFDEISLYTPGDVITCNFPIKNTGNLQAKYSTHTFSNAQLNENSSPIALKVVDYPKTLVAQADPQNVQIEIKYNWDKTTQPPADTLSSTFSIEFIYTQDLNARS